MSTADYELVYTSATLRITEEIRVAIEHNLTIELRQIKMTDWPDGSRSVIAEGRHIRKDGEPGRHRRGRFWRHPEPLPEAVRAIVEDARPGWWTEGGEA